MEAQTIDSATIDSASINLGCEEKTTLHEGAVVEDKMSPENSEYDSAGSYSDQEEDVKVRSRASDQDDNSDTGGSITLEREEGDGQESVPTKRIDDDEDKKNPQYIPKRGTFYEHDDRTADDVEEEKVEETEKDNGKKKVWQEKRERWSHDRFNENEQTPKSKAELVNIYGYDIRNEEGPPRARRRRRYGRGPNKYTRNWEDEDAYNKPPAKVIVKKTTKKESRTRRSTEDFPPLVNTAEDLIESADQQPVIIENHRKSEERTDPIREEIIQQEQHIEEHVNNNRDNVNEIQSNRVNQRIGSGRMSKPKKEIKDSDYRGFTSKTRLQRNLKSEQQKVLPPRNQVKTDFIQSQNFTNKQAPNNTIQEMEKEMSKLSVDGVYKGNKNNIHNTHRQVSVPPRLQNEQQKGSKRYSSMRQRSLPESNTPPVANYQPAAYYTNDYSQQGPPTTQPLLHQPPQLAPALPPLAQQVPVTAAPLLQAQFAPPFVQPPAPPAAFLQAAGVAPPAFMPSPQQPQMINFVQGQPAFAPPNFQGFQQAFSPVAPPTELYQPQGGITYYSTDQQVIQRPVPQKRPKAAIPIVAPPPEDKKEEEFNSSTLVQGVDGCEQTDVIVEQHQ